MGDVEHSHVQPTAVIQASIKYIEQIIMRIARFLYVKFQKICILVLEVWNHSFSHDIQED